MNTMANATSGVGAGSRKLTALPDAAFEEIKERIHNKLVDKLDLNRIGEIEGESLRREVRMVVEHLCDAEETLLNRQERERLIEEVLDQALGLGPLELLLKDTSISDILINGAKSVYIERQGRLHKSDVEFRDNGQLLQIIDRIVSRVGRRVDETCPMVDARLPDGSRVNAIIPPLALDGPAVSIRRFGVCPLKLENLLNLRAFTPEMVMLLEGAIKAKLNVIISGGTGSGKTTLLNVLSSFIGNEDRIVTIEDAAELQLQQEHIVRLETRPPNIEGRGEVRATELVRNALRMRPERIIIGECRGPETLDMLQAMNTGHDGSLTTIHANSSRDALGRLENLVGMSGVVLPSKALHQLIASSIHFIIQIARLDDGSRKITSIQEISGMEGDIITTQEIFCFRRTGTNHDGSVQGVFTATGIRPKAADKIRTFGFSLSDGIFNPVHID